MYRNRFALALVLSAAARATVPTIDESLSMKSVAGAQISPDGRYVAYSVQQTNWDENDFVSQIWIAVTATGERYQLTSGKKSVDGPAVVARFAPPCVHLRSRWQTADLFDLARGRRSRRSLQRRTTASARIAWSPDGSVHRVHFHAGPMPKAKKDRKEKYGEFDIIGGDYAMNHLWRVKVPAGDAVRHKKLAESRSR